MTRQEIIYTRLLERLGHFSLNEQHSIDFGESLGEEDQNIFLGIVEQLDQLIDKLKENQLNNQLPSDVGNILSVAKSLLDYFPQFPSARYSELLTMIHILDRIKSEVSGEEGFDVSENVEDHTFDLMELGFPVNKEIYFFHDINAIENSVFLISFKSMDNLQGVISSEPIPVELLFQLLAKIGTDRQLDTSKQYLLIKTGISVKTMEATLKLHLVKAGHYFHFPQAYAGNLNIHPDRNILPELEYQQFQDTLLIISEYNYQTDILDKYLRLYHVIENFMFRVPLVEMERGNNGAPFSIRDFQRLYKQVNTSELAALKALLIKVMDESYDSVPVTFKAYLFDKWTKLPSGLLTNTEITSLLSFLSVTTNQGNPIEFGDVTDQNIHSIFSQVVYYYRNAIVHNKDTELHLTHETLTNHSILGNTALKVLENFLIPCLEEIVFYLIIENNHIVRFQHSSLKLWEHVA